MSKKSELFASRAFYAQAHTNIVRMLTDKNIEFTGEERKKLQYIYRQIVAIEMLVSELNGGE